MLLALTGAMALGAGQPSVAAQAKHRAMIVFDRYFGAGTYEIYIMRADGSHQRRLTFNNSDNWGASLSPDGKHIVFTSNHDGDFEIFTMHTDGSHVRQLTHNTADDEYPSYSPNGKQIAFNSNRTGGNYNVFVMNADGSHQHAITKGAGDNEAPVFSPNGKKIAFSSARFGSPQIFTMRSDGSHPTQLTFDATTTQNYEPAYSPGGKLITFQSDASFQNHVCVIGVTGTHEHAVTKVSGDEDPVFSLNGTLIAFDHGAILTVHTDGSRRHALTSPPSSRFDEFAHYGRVPVG